MTTFLNLLATEPGFLAHDQHLERRSRFQAVEQADETGATFELRPRDAVVAEDELVADDPPL